MTGIGYIYKLQLLILEKHYIFNTGEKTALKMQKKRNVFYNFIKVSVKYISMILDQVLC